MDRRMRQVAGLITLFLLAVAVSAGWVQGYRAEQIASYQPKNDDGEQAINRFRIFQECRWRRGDILSIDGRPLAETVRTKSGSKCLYERTYPDKDLTAHVVGQWSLHFGTSGLENAYNVDLVGSPPVAHSIKELLNPPPRIGNTLISTIDTRLQKAALDALAGRRGGVVALNPKTGAVLVAASNPSYDPNPLASNDGRIATDARCALGVGEASCSKNSPGRPMTSVALQARRPPGSSFKVITAAAALESGKYTPNTNTGSGSEYTPPGETRAIHNFGNGSCGGTLANALRVSCNTSFARVAVDVGADQLYKTASAMGMDQTSGDAFIGCDGTRKSDIGGTRTGCLPRELKTADGRDEHLTSSAFLARAGFGQWVIQASPFGMALVAGTVANGGFVPKPRFAERVIDNKGKVVREVRTGIGASAISPEAAGQLAQMMRGVVAGGTAAGAFSGASYSAAGKTGTAQQPSCASDEVAIFGAGCGRFAHAWFMAFAPVEDPAIAVAVLVERGGGNSQATGGHVAAPVARKVLDTFFKLYPNAQAKS